MGYARILSGGLDGRYSIELDYGSSQKTALLAALSTLLARIDAAIGTQQILIADADVKETAQVARVQVAQAEIIAAASSLPPGSPRPDTLGFKFELAQLAQMKSRHAPLRLKLNALKFDRAQTLRRVAYWNSFNPVETRSAWCTDLTEDAAAGSYVATADLPGESNLIVLAPGCRPWGVGDGILTARELMSPAQAFFNAAILPGWQKFKPTYRWGTCTAIDEDADTMSVALASQPSSAQSLGINQSSTLTGVPVVYMTCNAEAFEVGDRVVVQFLGQAWSSPRVIGFLDNPVACIEWPAVKIELSLRYLRTGGWGVRPWFGAIQSDGGCGTQYNHYDPETPTGSVGTAELFYDATSASLVTPYPGAVINVVSAPVIELGSYNYGVAAPDTITQHVPHGDSPGVFIEHENTIVGFFQHTAFVRKEFAFESRTEHQYSADPVSCTPTADITAMHFSNSPTVPTPPLVTVIPFTDTQSGQTYLYGPGRIHQIVPQLPVITVTIEGVTKEYVVTSGGNSPTSSGTWDIYLSKKPRPA